MKTCALLSVLTLIASLFAPNLSHAQGSSGGVGGGGDILICKQNGPEKRFLLDVKEGLDDGNEFTGRPFQFRVPESSTLKDGVTGVLGRLARVDPARAKGYLAEALVFVHELEMLKANQNAKTEIVKRALKPLKDIDDADETYDYEKVGCKKLQLIRQEFNPIKKQVEYTVDLDLFYSLEIDSQIAAVTHEVIYKEVRDVGARTSRFARMYNRMILDSAIRSTGICTYMTHIENLGLGESWYAGLVNASSVKAGTSKADCSADGKLISLESPELIKIRMASYEMGGKKLEFLDSEPIQGKGMMIIPPSGSQDTDWGIDESQKRLAHVSSAPHDAYSKLEFHVTENGTVAVELSGKYSNPGQTLRLTLDGSGKILTLQHYGFKDDIKIDTVQALQSFVSHLKDRITQNLTESDVDLLQRKIERARIDAGKNDAIAIQKAALDLASPLPDGSTIVISEKAKAVFKALLLPKVVSCSSHSSGLLAAFIGGIEVAVRKVRCILTNGDELVFKPRVITNLILAFGDIGLYAGKKDSFDGDYDISTQTLTYSDRDGSPSLFAVGPFDVIAESSLGVKVEPQLELKFLGGQVDISDYRTAHLSQRIPGTLFPVNLMQSEIVVPTP